MFIDVIHIDMIDVIALMQLHQCNWQLGGLYDLYWFLTLMWLQWFIYVIYIHTIDVNTWMQLHMCDWETMWFTLIKYIGMITSIPSMQSTSMYLNYIDVIDIIILMWSQLHRCGLLIAWHRCTWGTPQLRVIPPPVGLRNRRLTIGGGVPQHEPGVNLSTPTILAEDCVQPTVFHNHLKGYETPAGLTSSRGITLMPLH